MAGLRRFANRVFVVTGGASGIGAATVREFASEGATVAIFDINQVGGSACANQLVSEGYNVQFYSVDEIGRASCRERV